MWKLVKISQQTYFIYCDFNSNKQNVTFILHDLKETWSQTLTLIEVKQKVKLLNKRLDFGEDNIKEAFTSDSLQSADIEESTHTSAGQDRENCLLKLKYRVKDRILNYEWILKKQTIDEFQQTFVQPLLRALIGCHEQIEILSETIRKKDVELKQYRIEGAVLNRKTVSTKPFDFENFHKNYKDCNEVATSFKELAKYVKENVSTKVPDIVNKPLNIKKVEENVKPEEKLKETNNTNTKLSPRQQKRKVNETKMQHLEEHLKRRKQGFEYESSQSQTPSSGNSQDTEENDKEDKSSSIKQAPKSNISSPRKSARCMPIKQNPEYISSEDKTDSGNEDKLSKLKECTTTNKTLNQTQNTGTSTSKEDISKSTENTKPERNTRSCVKSLSYKCPIQSLEKSSENSNVFDFSTDTEDTNDKALKDKIKKIKSNRNKMSLNKNNNLKSPSKVKVVQQNSDTDDDIPLADRKKLTQTKRFSPREKIGNKSPAPTINNKQISNSPIPKVINQLSDTDDDVPLMERQKLSKTNNLTNSIKLNSLISISPSSPRSKTLSHSPAPAIIDDISSQLNNIKKELESLEALRLADLKQRMCKA